MQRDKPEFVHLRLHSAYSLLEGALKINQIVKHACDHLMPAIAITDTNNLFGALEFSQSCINGGVQPIIGCQIAVDFAEAGAHSTEIMPLKASDLANLVLLAATEQGYKNLLKLASQAYLDKSDLDPAHIKASMLAGASEGLIILSGGPCDGPIDKAIKLQRFDQAQKLLSWLKEQFGDRFYIELQRHGEYDAAHESQMLALAYQHDVPLVATNEAFFADAVDYEAHDALLAVAEGEIVSNPNRRRVTADHYLKSPKEMVALFADLPEAIENTVEIALRCHVYADKRNPILPSFIEAEAPVKKAKGSKQSKAKKRNEASDVPLQSFEEEELERQAKQGLEQRIARNGVADGYSLKDYEERLAYELAVINKMQFPGYFLIVADFIKWAKQHDIPVGPGRGSGAGSLVAYALTITDIDPLRFSLLFERFLNPERVSMPDFDIDFCQDRREEVIHYVQQKYGRSQVAQIITFGKLQARIVLRDVGRVLEMPYRQVDYLTKLVPMRPGQNILLKDAISEEPKFAEEQKKDPLVGRLLKIALRLEGLYRHASTHAAGIVIGDRPLSELVPMYRDPRSDMPVTQFNMKYVEQAGLVKFDFLGLKTLTVLKTVVDLVAPEMGRIDLSNIPIDDEKTYELLAKGETVGVFQVESAGMRKALLGMKPDCIEDIIALVALYRPGPMDNIPVYNARKQGHEKVQSIHPKIDYLLKETQGVIVYQEQVMQIAQVLAGYSLGEADLLRRAMGKKIASEMEQQRSRFVNGAKERGVDPKQANSIFDLLAKFADYGFNKSHAAAYAMVSYQTAYMKAHYPVAFIAASMTYDMGNADKLNDFRRDAERMGIKIVPPSVQSSGDRFIIGSNVIYYALAAIKGVGESVAKYIVETRADAPFADLEDFCDRLDPRIVNKRALESLIQAGALDDFGIPREDLMASTAAMHARAARMRENSSTGQTDIFGMTLMPREPLNLKKEKPWVSSEKLHREFQVLGFYLTAHPLDEYKEILRALRVQSWTRFVRMVQRGASVGRLAGTITAKQLRKTRMGNKMAIVQLSDPTGGFEAVMFSEVLDYASDFLELGESVVVGVVAENRPEGINLRIQSMEPLQRSAERFYKTMRIFIQDVDIVPAIKSIITPGGDGTVSLILIQEHKKREVEVLLPGKFRIDPRFVNVLKAQPGVVNVELVSLESSQR